MAVPAPLFGTSQRSLEDDDRKGITFLYPFVYVSSYTDGTIIKINSVTGETETIASGFNSPEDMAFDQDEILYIGGVFTGVKRIDTKTNTILPDVGTNICGPEGPSIDSQGNVFVNTRREPCSHSGIWMIPGGAATTAERVVPPFSTWGEGTAVLTFGPFAGHLIAADAEGPQAGRIVRSAPPAFGDAVDFITGLCVPAGVAVNSKGEVFVADSCTGEIRRYDSSGGFLSVFTSGLSTPAFIEFDGAGNLYMAESAAHRVLKFSPDGTQRVLATGITDVIGIAVGKWP